MAALRQSLGSPISKLHSNGGLIKEEEFSSSEEDLALAMVNEEDPDQWAAVASMVGGGKTAEQVHQHYVFLLEDLHLIESGNLDHKIGAFQSNSVQSSKIDDDHNKLQTSGDLLVSIQEKIKWADTMSELDKKHHKEVEDRMEEVKKSLSIKSMCLTYFVAEVTPCKQAADVDFRGHEEIYSEPGGVMDYEEDRSRPKRQSEAASNILKTRRLRLKKEKKNRD
ncbi:hypothetical protein RJ641_017072 [Dillenia turbinata]|uniref:Myb-like domain-containing protein n=1 Tax=Dillenia turbinata TaxID=194707 RepID=A0AAN8UN81_9MAGN